MKQPVKKILAGAAALVITCAFLFSGLGFYNNYIVKKPLVQALNNIDGVQEVKLDKTEEDYRIIVASKQVENLQSFYMQLDEAAAEYLDRGEYKLQLIDCRDQHLNDLYSQLQPSIYEALAKDNYTWLQAEIGKQIKGSSPDTGYQFYIDENRIYLQMIQGDKSLYAVIPRKVSGEVVKI